MHHPGSGRMSYQLLPIWVCRFQSPGILYICIYSLLFVAGCYRPTAPPNPTQTAQDAAAAADQLLHKQRRLDETVWHLEQLAIWHERTVVGLWDRLRRDSPGQFAEVLATLLPASYHVRLPQIQAWHEADHQIEWADCASGESPYLPASEFLSLLRGWQAAGWQLVQSEWHHARFQPAADGSHHSTFQVLLHAQSADGQTRYEISGPLEVAWTGQENDLRLPLPGAIDMSQLRIGRRTGPAPFQETVREKLEPIGAAETFSDCLVCDLNGDGRSEIAYPRKNLLLLNDGQGHFQRQALCAAPLAQVAEAAFVDFNRDGYDDLLCAAKPTSELEKLDWSIYIFAGNGSGLFSAAPRRLTAANVKFSSPDSFTVGDIDLDGDIDIFLTQYLHPFGDGRMPAPYYDANDGLPAYLLLQQPDGTLQDVTLERGLEAKRRRRAYRSSLVDLDEDADLDLVVTSDFSGVDVYQNDGHGHFRDVTADWIDERANFGMSHLLADFNADGHLDLYVTGMASTTARRLQQLGLGRHEFPQHQSMRTKIAYGNRLYFYGAGPIFRHGDASADLARSGWSWGCAALDVDNDGAVDLYVANGHVSGGSAADYCSRFWCHDIYSGTDAKYDSAVAEVMQRNGALIGRAISWNGYEKNRLYLNRGREGFEQVSFLFNVAIENDSRPALADDLDGDGRQDIIVGWADRTSAPPQLTLQVLANRLETGHHWIGVRTDGVPAWERVGARVILKTSTGRRAATMITGESFACQRPLTCHFGLGTVDHVEELRIIWTGGRQSAIEHPEIDRYHAVH